MPSRVVLINNEDMQDIRGFLLKNGFTQQNDSNQYLNDCCRVSIKEDHFTIAKINGDAVHSGGLDLYCLIGVLTYNGYLLNQYRPEQSYDLKN